MKLTSVRESLPLIFSIAFIVTITTIATIHDKFAPHEIRTEPTLMPSERLENHVNEYNSIALTALRHTGLFGRHLSRHIMRGKVVVLDEESKKISPVLYGIPKDLRASSAKDVGTIVLLRWETKQVGTYRRERTLLSFPDNSQGTPAYSQIVHITVIDKLDKTASYEKDMEGEPPSRITVGTKGAASDTGYISDAFIGDYLKSLPRKP